MFFQSSIWKTQKAQEPMEFGVPFHFFPQFVSKVNSILFWHLSKKEINGVEFECNNEYFNGMNSKVNESHLFILLQRQRCNGSVRYYLPCKYFIVIFGAFFWHAHGILSVYKLEYTHKLISKNKIHWSHYWMNVEWYR